ncbi:MAG: metallophosphoesterase [Bacteroidales bacterium]|nr:metallophosphoesterase [Bacteroidales bacterium]
MKQVLTILSVIMLLVSCHRPQAIKDGGFTFAFMTDIHLQPERMAAQGFEQAIDCVNALRPDFVITGGDLVMDVLEVGHSRADTLFDMYESALKRFNIPVYNTMGNHEVFGLYAGSGVDPSDPDFGEKMYERRLGKRYYSFDHKGWHFMILDAVEGTPSRRYIGLIDSLQMEWIREDLKQVDTSTSIAITVHIPFISSFMQYNYGALAANDSGLVIINSKEVLDLFKGHSLRLVLQGHLHYVEDIHVDGIRFITGGAVCARWWHGPRNGMEEGFMLIHVNGDDIRWEYVDYGWEDVDQAKK